MALTGRYYLGDYQSNDAQYKGLMDAGITAAKALNLRPGISLTAEQVASLTTDIVWIEEQTITLADGSTQKALVPKVYTRQAVGQIDGTGSLIAAENLVINVTGDINNQGQLVGHNTLNVKALNLTNENGGVIAGDYLQLNTTEDLTNKSRIKAGSAANLDIGGNFNNQSQTYSTSSAQGLSFGSRTGISQLATIYVGDTLKGQTDENGNPLITFNANVGGTTTFDIGNDVNIKGGVLTTDELTGQVAGDLNMESLQDTYVYDSKQKNAGFSADIDLSGNAQANSLSINGGKTNIDADYAAVTEQTAIYTQKADLNVGGKGVIKGAAYTTASAEDNKSVFAQGIETSDIQNHINYDAKAIAAGISIGKAKDTNPEASLNGIGYGTDGDSQIRTTKAGVTGMAGHSDVTTATKESLNEPLENSFDTNTVNDELRAQVEITRAFDQERRKIKTELNKDEQKLRDEAKEQEALGNYTARNELLQQADKVQQKALLFDGITSALYGPNANGATGYLAKSISPQIANQIGKYYKDNDVTNKENQNKDLAGVNSPQHLLAHALLGAAVSAATGNDALTGGISASSGEVTATLLSKYIYKVDNLSELTAEQKDTISNITTLAGVAIGSTTGEVTDAVNAGETAKVAVEDNQMLVPQAYNILNAQEKKLYYKLKQNGAPELTVFVNAYNNCTTNSCREKVENSHIRASNAFGKNVLKLAKARKLNLVEMQMLLDNLSHKFAKASDGIKNDNSISNMETRHWTALGILGFSNELTEALSTARINYLYYDKGLRGDALVSQFKKDALTQELSLGLPIYTGVGGPPVFKRKNASQPVYTKPEVSSNKKPETKVASDNNIGGNNSNYDKSRHEAISGKVNNTKPIIQKDGYYHSDGMKITENYYNKLWSTGGRPAPFIQAREIINGNPKISLDPRGKPGFYKYEAHGLEMIYNPKTKEVHHIQPVRSRKR